MEIVRRAKFPTTLWTRIAHASDASHPSARAAYEELFQRYWYPVYAYIRRQRPNHDDAIDLTQAFFADVYEHNRFSQADRRKGRFRPYLQRCLHNFMHDDYDHRTALSRGGQALTISFDDTDARTRYDSDNVDDLTPEKLFNRKMAEELLDNALRELAEEASSRGHALVFAALRPRLAFDGDEESYRSIAGRLDMEINTVKSHADRFRKRFRVLIRERVGQLVGNEDDIDAETVALEESL